MVGSHGAAYFYGTVVHTAAVLAASLWLNAAVAEQEPSEADISATEPSRLNIRKILKNRGYELKQPDAQRAPSKIRPALKAVLSAIKTRGISRGQARVMKIHRLSNRAVRVSPEGRVQVYIRLHTIGDTEIAELAARESEIQLVNQYLRVVQARVPFDRLEEIAMLPFVRQVSAPRYGRPRVGSVTTEADAILRSDVIRQLGLDGSGVRVGVISDGVNGKASSQASGDLPDTIAEFGSCTPEPSNFAQCDPGLGCTEGTALLEIIHDIAPGAQLGFGSGLTSLEFIQRVDELVNNFNADIIVDDVGFGGEPFFADGEVAQAVAAVADQVVFVSAAGNGAFNHYEAGYQPVLFQGSNFHNFGAVAGQGFDVTMSVTILPGQFVVPLLQWNDPFGGSANDYDLLLLNEQGTDLLCPECASTGFQAGTQDPIEALCYFNSTGSLQLGQVAVTRASGVNKRMEMFLRGGAFPLEHVILEGSIVGHPGLPNVLAVGAIDAADPGHDEIEFYSSQGPSRIDFPTIQTRQKPDITALDGVSVTGAGGFPTVVFGTSAAAPQVAGIAALLKQAAPTENSVAIRAALKDSAIDLGAAGIDPLFGNGRVDAVLAYTSLTPDVDGDGVPFPNDNCNQTSNPDQLDTDGDGDGDACDADDDNDGVPDMQDAFPLDPAETTDTDGDGFGDNVDVFPNDPNEHIDNDTDGVGDNADADDDNDGLPDLFEITNGLDPLNAADRNGDADDDGFTNAHEFAAGTDPNDPQSTPNPSMPWLPLLLED